MNTALVIELYTGDYADLMDLLQMSTGLDSLDGVRHLLAIEMTRGTRYYVARMAAETVGLIGVWFDPTGQVTELEPPQIIDMAVKPAFRRQGVARALMDKAVGEVRAAGFKRLWLYTDGDSVDLFTFYRKLGYRLAAVVPDWFGDGSAKAIFRLDLHD